MPGPDGDKVSLWVDAKGNVASTNVDKFSKEDIKWIRRRNVLIKKFGGKLEKEIMQRN